MGFASWSVSIMRYRVERSEGSFWDSIHGGQGVHPDYRSAGRVDRVPVNRDR